MEETRICKVCNLKLPRDQFYRTYLTCKPCQSIKDKARSKKYREENAELLEQRERDKEKQPRTCEDCNQTFLGEQFSKAYYYKCKPCYAEMERNQRADNPLYAEKRKVYYEKTKEHHAAVAKIYRDNPENKIKRQEYIKQYELENAEKIKQTKAQYRKNNHDIILEKQRAKKSESKIVLTEKDLELLTIEKENKIRIKKENKKSVKNLPENKIRFNVSGSIRSFLKRNNSNKNKLSCQDFLNYNIDNLKPYFFNQFESWMTWENYGVSKVWLDSDSSTHTWQIDHIIPQSALPYFSMDSLEFKIIWSLENLRPLSAKENVTKGNKLIHELINPVLDKLKANGTIPVSATIESLMLDAKEKLEQFKSAYDIHETTKIPLMQLY